MLESVHFDSVLPNYTIVIILLGTYRHVLKNVSRSATIELIMSGQDASRSSGDVHFKIIQRRHGQILLRAGHQYNVKRKHNSGLTVWECTKRKKETCRGGIKTNDNKIIVETAHTCTPDIMKNIVEEKIYECKQKIVSENYAAVPQTYNAMIGSFEETGLELVCKIPDFQNVKSSLYRYRNASAGVTKLKCMNAEEIEVPHRYQNFMLADYKHSSNRIVLFCSRQARQIMCEVENFYSDGTFKSCTPPFEQLYTIHGDLGSSPSSTNIVPLVYALMKDRKIESYTILFSLIKSQIPLWNPRTYKTDYERAAMSAIMQVFPTVTVSGCYYHYNKAIWKKGRDLGITKSENEINKREIALSAVLPLLPVSEIKNGWNYITRKPAEDENIQKFRAYMTRQWIKDDFIKTWCVYGQQHRTTNYLEGWHYKLNQEMGKKKPNIIHFLNVLKNDAAYFSVCDLRIKNKQPMKKREQKQINRDQFIQEALSEFVQKEMSVGHLLEILRR